MQKKHTPLLLALTLTVTAPPTLASGIPVVDVAGLTQMVIDGATRAQEFSQTITEARNRLNQLRSQAEHYKSMVEGHYNFESILNDRGINDVIDLSAYSDLYDAVEDVSDLREQFNLYSDDPIVQRRYDMELKQYRFQETLYQRNVKRSERMSDLLDQFDSATTPAAKADLANSINFEQMQMKNDNNMMVAMANMLERQKTLEIEQRLNASYQKARYGNGLPY